MLYGTRVVAGVGRRRVTFGACAGARYVKASRWLPVQVAWIKLIKTNGRVFLVLVPCVGDTTAVTEKLFRPFVMAAAGIGEGEADRLMCKEEMYIFTPHGRATGVSTTPVYDGVSLFVVGYWLSASCWLPCRRRCLARRRHCHLDVVHPFYCTVWLPSQAPL